MNAALSPLPAPRPSRPNMLSVVLGLHLGESSATHTHTCFLETQGRAIYRNMVSRAAK